MGEKALCFFRLSIFRLLKDNPAIEYNRRMKISRTISSMFQLALPLDFAVTSEGKTRHAPLLFSPFSTASCAQARSPFPWKFTPFRLRYASCKAVALLKVTLGKSVILPRFIELFGCSVTLPLALPAKIHSFRPRSCDKSHSFGKCARRILEATLAKTWFCFALLHFILSHDYIC